MIPGTDAQKQRVETIPCSHYSLRSLSWTSWAFYFLDSRDLLEVLRNFLGGSSLGVSLSLPRKSSENLEVPRIWEGEGPGGPR